MLLKIQELLCSSSMAPLTSLDRELRFVAVSGQKSRTGADKGERRSVRAFVMRDYLRNKNDPNWNFTPAKVTDRMTSHISRFRSSRPESATTPRKRKTATTRGQRVESSSSQRLLIPATGAMADQSSTVSSPHDLDMMDPFGTLAVDVGDADTRDLLQYYQTTFWANSYACNPEAQWISVALMDPAIIHATLSLVAIHRRDCFSFDLSKVYFKHRGEAMKIVAQRLSNMHQSLTDETIGAVALLSSSDNHFDWPSDAQSTHSQALGRLIAMRGGMQKLTSNRHIQRVAGWADMLQSAMHGTDLQVEMPAAIQEISTGEDSNQNVRGIGDQDLPMGILLRDLSSNVGSMLRQLRILSSLKVSLLEERNEELCHTFSNLLWKLEYSILARSEKLHLTRHGDIVRDALLSKVVGTATLIFSYLTLRDLAAPILYTRLSQRLSVQFSSTMMSNWNELGSDPLAEEELAIILWALFLGWRGSRKDHDKQAWYVDQLAQVCWRHGVLSYNTIKAKIQSVLPQAHTLLDISEEFWIPVEEMVWSEMLSLDESTMILG